MRQAGQVTGTQRSAGKLRENHVGQDSEKHKISCCSFDSGGRPTPMRIRDRARLRKWSGTWAAMLVLLSLALVSPLATAQMIDVETEWPGAQGSSGPPLGSTEGMSETFATPHSAQMGQPVARIKDVARLRGVRDNQLVGMGLVVGLDGSGDGRGAQANVQMVANMLARFGLGVEQETLRLRNAAAVVVTAELPPFHRPGDRIDVVVSSFGDARSLQGGFLLQTPLQAGNGEVYAVAQGPVSIGGFNVRTGGSQTQRNHAVVGRVPNGAIVEREVLVQLNDDQLTWLLHQPDFTTASRVAAAINDRFPSQPAVAQDGGSVVARVPENYRGRLVEFIAQVEALPVMPDAPARVVINERTGTVVMGHHVRIATVAVSHGNLTVRITPETEISQPPPFSGGETVVVERERIEVEEDRGQVTLLEGGATVEQVIQALNAIGVGPRDMIAIFQALKAAGALYGELEII